MVKILHYTGALATCAVLFFAGGCGPFWVNPYITVEQSNLNWMEIHYYNTNRKPVHRVSLSLSGSGHVEIKKGTSPQISDDFAKNDFSTADGRFYSFSFWAGMPKLNTNNPEVVKYFSDLCCYWAREWDIDGIRFDVGDEISHSFIRALRTAVKAVKPDIYLLGEIWMDSLNWLSGDEYDAVMNYPFTGCVNDFWKNESLTVTDFMHAMNYCHSLYPEQVNRAMLNFLDTHDTARAAESSKNNDVLLQKLAVLLTMTGSPCLYYGTEIAMKGLYTPYNRSCMPWEEIDRGDFSGFTEKVRQLLALRKALPELRGNELHYESRSGYPRLLQYTKGGSVRVLINAGQEDIRVDDSGEILFANGFCDGWLRRDGIVILS